MFKLILTDINMPQMDGMVMSKKIFEMLESYGIENNTKIYAITAMNEDFISETFSQFGIEEVLKKPVDIKRLTKIIEKNFT